MTILKPRVATSVAMILGGAFIAYLLFVSAYIVARYASWGPALVPALVGLLGVFWIVAGTLTLVRRSRAAITIDEGGITIPQGSLIRPRSSLLIPRTGIASIGKHESIKGRLIEITLTTGDRIPIQARHYCELKTFLDHCKAHELPTI
jgi:hypothetical protein